MVRAVDGGLAQFHRLSIHGESVVQATGRNSRCGERNSTAWPTGACIEGRGFWPGYPRPEQRREARTVRAAVLGSANGIGPIRAPHSFRGVEKSGATAGLMS